MTQFNSKGFVVRQSDGRLVADSHVSAYSRRRAVTHVQLEPVEDCPGLFVRIATREIAQVTDKQRADVHEQARAWYLTIDGVPDEPAPTPGVSFETPEPNADALQDTHDGDDSTALTIDDVTLDELLDIARDLGIPGRSKMDKAALFEAVRQASGVSFETPEGEEVSAA